MKNELMILKKVASMTKSMVFEKKMLLIFKPVNRHSLCYITGQPLEPLHRGMR